eukprot:scaffold90906_cov67-Phaeocystis_antarctica.AAC.2
MEGREYGLHAACRPLRPRRRTQRTRLYYLLARGEDLLRSRRGVARHALRGLEPTEGELALRPGMRGAVGVHGLVEPSVGVGEGDELQGAQRLAAHGLADEARLRVHVLARHGLAEQVDAHELAERLEHGGVVGHEVVVVDNKQLVARPMLGPACGPVHGVLVHADHHVQGRRVDPLPVSVVGVPEVLHAGVGVLQHVVPHPRVNLRLCAGCEHPRVLVGGPLIVPREHPLRRLAQDSN